jgi:quercetin dioxygenase-like cupin family protein
MSQRSLKPQHSKFLCLDTITPRMAHHGEDAKKVQEMLEGPWDSLALYTLSKGQIELLTNNQSVSVHKGWLPARFTFPEHAHAHAQMLLVTSGKLTHVSKSLSYTQSPGDVLIVPARMQHSAFVHDEELEFFLISKS